MDARTLIDFLGTLERLKGNTRHSWTSDGTHETVAAHSWRLAVMALLIREDMPDIDMGRVVEMCLVHDFGEAVTGDIPAFLKTGEDEIVETAGVRDMLARLPQPQRGRIEALFDEMDAMSTPEARVYKALDKLEALIQHNEASLETWLPLEYDLQRTYGTEEAAGFPYLAALRAQVLADTDDKVAHG